MIRIVSGYVRSGTSMMMQALAAGGLDPAFDIRREPLNKTNGDEHYLPNKGGFFEVLLKEYESKGFPSQYEGRLIKVICWGLDLICEGKYQIVLMLRDPEEIRQSLMALEQRWFPEIKNYREKMDNLIEKMRARPDVDLTVLKYRDVIEYPQRELEKLAHWGINVAAAVQMVDPKQCRYRREDLTVGI